MIYVKINGQKFKNNPSSDCCNSYNNICEVFSSRAVEIMTILKYILKKFLVTMFVFKYLKFLCLIIHFFNS